jgi:hypothetical protein
MTETNNLMFSTLAGNAFWGDLYIVTEDIGGLRRPCAYVAQLAADQTIKFCTGMGLPQNMAACASMDDMYHYGMSRPKSETYLHLTGAWQRG